MYKQITYEESEQNPNYLENCLTVILLNNEKFNTRFNKQLDHLYDLVVGKIKLILNLNRLVLILC